MSYVGIDLGTTNSAICSFDGEEVSLHKSPEQNDVTPSAIFVDRRGNKYLGARAYNNAARSPDNAATLFKRLMGTSTPIRLEAVDRTLTPEQCSAEILQLLFGYLPEEHRQGSIEGTVITVPAAFNQMQKDATLSAAEMAGIGKIALMQEPVAAVMSVMRETNSDGTFLVYDLGGGTLDIAVAESIAGRVTLLAHGGIPMCGGRDFDRTLFDNVVKPWLHSEFDLPDDLMAHDGYRALVRLAQWATERAKIELSQRETAEISLSETELGLRDEAGQELYIQIPLGRERFDELIEHRLAETISAARDTLEHAGLRPEDVERVVFVGGPTQYKPLRDKVSFELGIAPSTAVNPMTAVATGAAIFAESIDWTSQSRGRKSSRGAFTGGEALALQFDYVARTPSNRARMALRVERGSPDGAEFQVESLETGWSSGRVPLEDGRELDLPLSKLGENVFKIFLFDESGAPVQLEEDRVAITRTAASVDAIPASHSLAIEVSDEIGGRAALDYLVRAGDQLPAKGRKVYRAGEALRAGSSGRLLFKLWEGEIEDPVTDNDFIGSMKITGSDFDEGVIPAGAELVCDYEILDSGNVVLEVTAPSVGGAFHSGRNFYSRQEGTVDYADARDLVRDEAESVAKRVDALASRVSDDRITDAHDRVESARAVSDSATPEDTKEAMDALKHAKRLLAKARKDHYEVIRRIELEAFEEYFEGSIREHARPSEVSSIENLIRTARRAMGRPGPEFETHLSDLRDRCFAILWRQDWYIVGRFRTNLEHPHLFGDKGQFDALAAAGRGQIETGDIDGLRETLWRLEMSRVGFSGEEDMLQATNIVRG